MTEVTMLPKLYSEEEAATYLGVCRRTLARERSRERLRYIRIGKAVKFTHAHLEQYLKDRECGTTSSNERTASGTSAGSTPMDAQAAHRLAREIVGKRT